MTLALEGIRVLDLTDAISGPFTGMLLGHCGAEVIRVESLRHLGFREGNIGPEKDTGVPMGGEDDTDFTKVDKKALITPNFSRFNLDKQSVVLNLVKPEGKDLFRKLVALSDVVVNNLSFGVMRRWGFDYPSLKQVKDDIIVVDMPPMGEGPYQMWTTWGMNLLSFTGIAYGWAHADTPMEERAASSTYGDYIAALKTASSIMAALYHRARTGEGQYIELVQAEATASVLGPAFLDYFVNGRVSPPRGNRHPLYAPYNCYPCKGEDRWCVIAVCSEDEWQSFCRALASPEWTREEKYSSMESRLKNAGELDKHIEAWTKERTPHQVMKLLQSFGVAAGAVQDSEDLYYDLQLRARNHMVELNIGGHSPDKITFDGPPLHLASGQKPQPKRAPLLGEQNDYIYQQLLGLSPQEVKRLIKDKVIY